MKACTKCDILQPVDQFRLQAGRATRRSNCRACDGKRQREWASANREKVRANDRARWRGPYRWASHIKRTYGITPADYDRMLSAQGGKCAICPALAPGGNSARFHVDHCHATSVVRGLLCSRCNQMLGQAHDDVSVLAAAIQYLSRGEKA